MVYRILESATTFSYDRVSQLDTETNPADDFCDYVVYTLQFFDRSTTPAPTLMSPFIDTAHTMNSSPDTNSFTIES